MLINRIPTVAIYKTIILAFLTTILSHAMEEEKTNSQKSNNANEIPFFESKSEKTEAAIILLNLYKSRSHLTTKTDIKKTKCNYCKNVFMNDRSLSNHISLYHTKRFFCKYKNCKKSYKLLSNLEKHLKTVHNNQKNKK